MSVETVYQVLNRTDVPVKDHDTTSAIHTLIHIRIVIAVIGLFLNVLTIVLLFHIHQEWRLYLWHILNLTISDLIMSAGIVFYFILDRVFDHKSTVVHCIMFFIKALEAFSVLLCLCMLVVIAADQCVAVVRPLKYHQICTKKITKIILLCVWNFTFLVNFTGIIVSTLKGNGEVVENCLNIQRHITLDANAVLVMMSCPVFLTLYIVIYSRIRALKRRDSQRGRRVSMKRATTTTLSLVIPFLLVYLPTSIYILIISVMELNINWPFWEVFMIVLAVHTVIDPIIYAIRVKEIQDGYKRLFSICWP